MNVELMKLKERAANNKDIKTIVTRMLPYFKHQIFRFFSIVVTYMFIEQSNRKQNILAALPPSKKISTIRGDILTSRYALPV